MHFLLLAASGRATPRAGRIPNALKSRHSLRFARESLSGQRPPMEMIIAQLAVIMPAVSIKTPAMRKSLAAQ